MFLRIMCIGLVLVSLLLFLSTYGYASVEKGDTKRSLKIGVDEKGYIYNSTDFIVIVIGCRLQVSGDLGYEWARCVYPGKKVRPHIPVKVILFNDMDGSLLKRIN